MFAGVFALLERSLRIESRALWSAIPRLATVLAGLWALYNAEQAMAWQGAPGLNFFQTLIVLNGLLIAVAGISYFPSVITEEKEEKTLGLMRMTGLSSLSILVGKAGSRFVQATLLILLQVPFALLGITLGGITLDQILAITCALVTLLYFVANVALLVSVVSPTSRRASVRMGIISLLYVVAYWVASEMVARNMWTVMTGSLSGTIAGSHNNGLVQFIYQCFIFTRVADCLRSGASPALFSTMEWFHLIVGSLAFLTSWGIFGGATRQPDTEQVSRSWWLSARRKGVRWLSPGRTWNSAMFWKEFHFLLGGWPFLALKAAGYTVLYFALHLYWSGIYPNSNHGVRWADDAFIIFTSWIVTWEAAMYASRMFQEELRHQTWSTLVATPLSLATICYGKVAVALIGLAPGLTALGARLILSEEGQDFMRYTFDDPMFWGVVALFITVIHFCAAFSLYIRWGIIPLALASVWLPFFGFIFLCFPRGPDASLGVMTIFMCTIVCGITHAWIGSSLQELASQ